jgi:CheY-like chemotaxis protein
MAMNGLEARGLTQPEGAKQERNGKTILVVDDDEVFCLGIELVLQGAGYMVLHAGNGQEAVDYLQSGQPAPDLILLDMIMPLHNGWNFMAQRKANPTLSAIPFVIMTAMGVGNPEWAASLGAIGYIRKPVEVECLLEIVGSCLQAQKHE